MTWLQAAAQELPADEEIYVLHGRPLRPGAQLGQTARLACPTNSSAPPTGSTQATYSPCPQATAPNGAGPTSSLNCCGRSSAALGHNLSSYHKLMLIRHWTHLAARDCSWMHRAPGRKSSSCRASSRLSEE